jgi:Xaa-Pro aminopeptidase
MDYVARRKRLQQNLAEKKLDALLVTHLPNIRYLCGFTGSAGALWVTPSQSIFFTDARYTTQSREEVKGARTVIARKALLPTVAATVCRHLPMKGKKRIVAVEADYLSLAASERLRSDFSGVGRLKPTSGLIEQFRLFKDADEVNAIRKAVDLGASLFHHTLAALRPGTPEVQVAAAMEGAARNAGAEAMSFETIIAGGARSALPHGRASLATIPARGFVVCDFGVILHGYCSDRTRTVWMGAATAEARRVYAAVLEAQLAAIAAVRPGVALQSVDGAARNVLKKHDLGKYFTHSTGHGVGLEIHEAPRVAQGQTDILQPGMVITIEPGVYLAGEWGVRIEDMVIVTPTGSEVLAPTQKEFLAV